MNLTYIILAYFLAINLIAFFVYGLDKLLSTGQSRRIRERTLLLLALFGGSLGAIGGMQLFRHKTAKSSFQGWLALILTIQLILVGIYLYYNNILNTQF